MWVLSYFDFDLEVFIPALHISPLLGEVSGEIRRSAVLPGTQGLPHDGDQALVVLKEIWRQNMFYNGGGDKTRWPNISTETPWKHQQLYNNK